MTISLQSFVIYDNGVRIRPAHYTRAWMEKTANRFAYRCSPMAVANSLGWEATCPSEVQLSWDGGPGIENVSVTYTHQEASHKAFVCSHFGHGIVTFHTGRVFRTSPGWAMWVRGIPNSYKEAITPLEGVAETEWLPFSFTVNWRFTRAGRVSFLQDEPFAFLTLTPISLLENLQPNESKMDFSSDLGQAYTDWSTERSAFNARLAANESSAVLKGWEKKHINDRPQDVSTGRPKIRRSVRQFESGENARNEIKPGQAD